MSDTPETDKVWKADDVVARVMVSRKLERERNELKHDFEEQAEVVRNLKVALEEVAKLSRTLRDERDEAREKNAKLRDIASAFAHFIENPPYGVDQAVSKMLLLERWKMMREEEKKC